MNSLKNCSNAYKVSVRPAIALRNNFVTIIFFATFLFFAACGPSREEADYREKAKQVTDVVNSYDKNIATDTIDGIAHNFIRQAGIKFKVKDVLQCTKEIEQIATLAGGYTTNSELVSNKDYSNSIRIKEDSLKELTYFTLTSNITLRVPNKKLDSVLTRITDMAIYIDYRTIKSDDVKLKLYANKLSENRHHEFNKRVAKKIDLQSSKLNQVTKAEENILEKQTIADNKSVESFDLIDQVNYSTVVLSLYQAQGVHSGIIALPPSIKPYEPSFINKLCDSFLNGFEIIKNFALFFINFWGLFFILITLFVIGRRIFLYYTKKETPAVQS